MNTQTPCCETCFRPSIDSTGEDYVGALPEYCADEECDCHTPHTESWVEKNWKQVEDELKYVATYASPERREQLLGFLKNLFERLLRTERESYQKELVASWEKKIIKKEERLPYENSPDIYGNARMEAYKKGYNQAIEDIIRSLN